MKSILTTLIGLLFFFSVSGQTNIEVTSELQNKIKQDIEKEVLKLKQQLEKDRVNPVEIEFTLDTFRVEKFMEKYIELDFTDFGMRDAGYKTAIYYDSLMNKYYKKLLSVFKGDDKKILIQAQKAWLTFRSTETKLVGIISKDEYSGGGTMQQLAESSEYLNLIKNRTIAIFEHYVRATQNY
jgi:uncharacterized protein YecT (DUF1311 family)